MEDKLADIQEIRKMMEKSTSFLSLSGFSGLITGLLGLIGGWFCASQSGSFITNSEFYAFYTENSVARDKLITTFTIVMVLAFVAAAGLSIHKAYKQKLRLKSNVSYRFLASFLIPLFAGGIFILVLKNRMQYDLILAAMLLFYGLALFSSAKHTVQEIFWMGTSQIALSLIALLFSATALICWIIGFGLCNALYGSLIYYKYERKSN